MSNILIIKHGSLGDLIQANGAIKDIKEHFKSRKVFLLTSEVYAIFMSECPYIDGVIIDKRLPRWNLFFLYKYCLYICVSFYNDLNYCHMRNKASTINNFYFFLINKF